MKFAVWLGLAGVFVCAFIAALGTGDQPIAPLTVISALIGAEGTPPVASFIVTELRLPRAVLAALVGAALAAAGTATQALMQNPLAEPGILGINAGAALAAMAVIISPTMLHESVLPLFAFCGALVMSACIYALSWRGGLNPLRIILIGIGLGALAGAAASFLSVFGPVVEVQRAAIWLAGSLHDSRWIKSVWLISGGLPAFVALWVMSRELDLIAFQDDVAKGLGLRINLVRSAIILAVACLAGMAVAASGPIAFVGLAAPHIARRLVGIHHAILLPAAAITGAILVILSDLFARLAFAPGQLPVGLATAMLGAPLFGYMLWKKRHE